MNWSFFCLHASFCCVKNKPGDHRFKGVSSWKFRGFLVHEGYRSAGGYSLTEAIRVRAAQRGRVSGTLI